MTYSAVYQDTDRQVSGRDWEPDSGVNAFLAPSRLCVQDPGRQRNREDQGVCVL